LLAKAVSRRRPAAVKAKGGKGHRQSLERVPLPIKPMLDLQKMMTRHKPERHIRHRRVKVAMGAGANLRRAP
jgi:hypothetical protein